MQKMGEEKPLVGRNTYWQTDAKTIEISQVWISKLMQQISKYDILEDEKYLIEGTFEGTSRCINPSKSPRMETLIQYSNSVDTLHNHTCSGLFLRTKTMIPRPSDTITVQGTVVRFP